MEDGTYRELTGMKVTNEEGTFYFSEPGNWIDENGMPIYEKLHRTDGPAIELSNRTKIWFINGEELTKKQFNKWREQNGRWNISSPQWHESD